MQISNRQAIHKFSLYISDAETVEGLALALERVDDVLGRDRLALGVLRVGQGVADDDVQEGLQHLAGLRIDGRRNSLNSTSASQSADSRLCNAR